MHLSVPRHLRGENGDDRTFCPQNVSNILSSKCFETVGRDILSSLRPRTFGRANCDIRRCCSEGWGMRRALVHLRPTPAVGLEQRPRHSERCTLRRRQDREDRTFNPHYVSEHSALSMFPRILSRQEFPIRVMRVYISSAWTLPSPRAAISPMFL